MGQAKHAPIIPTNRLHSRDDAKLSTATRRAALAATFALSTVAGAGGVLAVTKALGAEPHPDAALLAIEPEYMRLAAGEDAAVAAEFKVENRAHAIALKAAPGHIDDARWFDAIDAAKREVDLEAAEEATRAARDTFFELADRVVEMRAVTLDGLRAKARMHRHYDPMAESILADLRALNGQGGAVRTI